MTGFHNTFEGGTEGANITIANSGGSSGDAFTGILSNNTAVGTSGNANMVYKAAAALTGSMGLQITLTASTSYVYWQDSTGGGDRGGMWFPIYIPSTPAATSTLAILRNSTGSMCYLQALTTGQLRVYNAANTALSASDFTPTTNTLYWGQLIATKGTTTSNGRIEFKVYAADATTQVHSWDSGATTNTGTTVHYIARFGVATTSSGWTTINVDGIRYESNWPTGDIGPYIPSNLAPTCTLTASETADVEPGRLVTLTATTTDSDGTSSITDLSQIDGTPTATLTDIGGDQWTFVAPATLAGDTYTFRATATDDDAATTTADVTVAVLPASIHLKTAGGIVGAVAFQKRA